MNKFPDTHLGAHYGPAPTSVELGLTRDTGDGTILLPASTKESGDEQDSGE